MTRLHPCALLLLLALPGALRAEIEADRAIEAAIDAGFSDLERQIIEEYYGRQPQPDEPATGQDSGKDRKEKKHKGKNGGLPPGLAKRGELPPGLAKRSALPPGLTKRTLPDDLEKQLPPPPPGYRRQIVNDLDHAVIVLVHEATDTVADLIKDVVIPDAKD